MTKKYALCSNCGENEEFDEIYSCEKCGNMICDVCAIQCDKCKENYCDACYSEHEC